MGPITRDCGLISEEGNGGFKLGLGRVLYSSTECGLQGGLGVIVGVGQ